jgi:hypothetical protein
MIDSVNDGIIQDSILDSGTIPDMVEVEEIRVISFSYSGEDSGDIVVTVNNATSKISATLKQVQYDTLKDFPAVGSDKLLYIDRSESSIYFYDTKSATYKSVAGNGGLVTEEFVTGLLSNYVTKETLENYATNSRVDEVESVAKGATQAVSFGNYSTMITSLNALGNNVYNVGQNIMIKTLHVPDLWVAEVATTSTPYTYTSDENFVNDLKANEGVKVGYYILSQLETQKVDLTDYETTTNVDKKLSDLVAELDAKIEALDVAIPIIDYTEV